VQRLSDFIVLAFSVIHLEKAYCNAPTFSYSLFVIGALKMFDDDDDDDDSSDLARRAVPLRY